MKSIYLRMRTILLLVCMVFMSVTPSFAEEGDSTSRQSADQIEEVPDSSVPESTLDYVQNQEEDWTPPDPQPEPDPTEYSNEDIRALPWTQLSADTAIQIQHTYDRPLLKLAAYFYSVYCNC